MEEPTIQYVTSQDGTRVGYVCYGASKSAPGLVLIQGAFATAYNYDDLARALSHRFAVYAAERRGRGLTPKEYANDHSIARDVEDIDAIFSATGARYVFGLSSGAMIALEAARTLVRVERAAVFEPPFYTRGMDHEGIRRLNWEVERGHTASALVTALDTAETAPWIVRILPKVLARLLAFVVLLVDDRIKSPYAKLRNLVPACRFDFHVVGEMDGKMSSFAALDKPMLLLSGTKSTPFLLESIRHLKDVLPKAEHIEFEGMDHSGPWNAGRGGSPQIVGAALETFFA